MDTVVSSAGAAGASVAAGAAGASVAAGAAGASVAAGAAGWQAAKKTAATSITDMIIKIFLLIIFSLKYGHLSSTYYFAKINPNDSISPYFLLHCDFANCCFTC
jgi:hypothetical protein